MKLTIDQVIEYQTRGYVIAEGILTDEDLNPLIGETDHFVEDRARILEREGKITNLYRDQSFQRRFASLCRECPEFGRGFDLMYLQGRAMFNFLRNANLLDAVECLLGSEITCNPVQHLRAKVPSDSVWREISENVPWHQDAEVNRGGEGLQSDIITCWIPLVDVTEENGCMQLMPDTFKFGLLDHVSRPDKMGPEIEDRRLDDSSGQSAPCSKGGVIFINKYTPHRGLPNRTNIVRWSLDIRYQRTGTPSGRPLHPHFTARSRIHPESVLKDYEQWCAMWNEGLKAKPFTLPQIKEPSKSS